MAFSNSDNSQYTKKKMNSGVGAGATVSAVVGANPALASNVPPLIHTADVLKPTGTNTVIDLSKGYYEKPKNNNNTKTGGGGSSKGSASSGSSNAMSYLEALRAQQQANAEAAYANARNALNDAYNSASEAYGNIYNSGAAQLGRSYDNSRGKINSEATDAFREAYVNRMLSEKNLGQRLAAMGMSGGASESTLAGLINNYGNARNGIQKTLDTNLGDLEMNYQGNLANLYNAYQQNMANIASQRASQLANLEMQLANLNANMGDDYYSMLMSNLGGLQNIADNAVANQSAYQAPEAQNVTNTFNPANTTQTNDIGGRATNWWREYIENLRFHGQNDLGIQQNLIKQGLTDAEIARLLNA